jgi:hypothetical protein
MTLTCERATDQREGAVRQVQRRLARTAGVGRGDLIPTFPGFRKQEGRGEITLTPLGEVEVLKKRNIECVNYVGMKAVQMTDELFNEAQDVAGGVDVTRIRSPFKAVPEGGEVEMNESFTDLATLLRHPWEASTHPSPDFGLTKEILAQHVSG